jgi:toxin ParE1/3/4
LLPGFWENVPQLDITARAFSDLADVFELGQEIWGREQSEAYFNNVLASLRRLETFPLMAPELPDRRDGVRRLNTGSHMALYRLEGDTVRILRILHQRMDPSRHLG